MGDRRGWGGQRERVDDEGDLRGGTATRGQKMRRLRTTKRNKRRIKMNPSEKKKKIGMKHKQ